MVDRTQMVNLHAALAHDLGAALNQTLGVAEFRGALQGRVDE
jgi:hypothetical protein